MNSSVVAMSKTQQYRKVVKPMIERQRRARINKSLEELKTLIMESMQQEGEQLVKMEKTDILEMTVKYLRNIKKSSAISEQESFRRGYINAANEVSRTLAFLPQMDISVGKNIMTHLGQQLNQMTEQPTTKVQCPSPSPASSGYGSESDNESVNSDVWRPW
ncbi:HES6.2 family protein [Megaselia abdita]